MPYADPEKKRLYQKAYFKEWYRRNKEPRKIINRNANSKKALRGRKKEWIVKQFEGVCSQCTTIFPSSILNVRITDKTAERRWGDTYGGGSRRYKSVTDYSWDDLNAKVHTFSLICHNCLKSKEEEAKPLHESGDSEYPASAFPKPPDDNI